MKVLVFLILLVSTQFLFAETFSMMSYNVENLFDTVHDENKDDWEFLPKDTPGKKEACEKIENKRERKDCLKADWTDKKLEMKLTQISEVVKGYNTNLPDFLGVVEIENKNVLTKLGDKLGYKEFEVTESPDKRGVDVGLFYKTSNEFKKVSRAEHVVPTDYPTRNILEVRFSFYDKKFLTVFVNHWPSLHNPDSARIKAAEVLAKRVQEILKTNPDELIVAMGDFNTIDSNDPHPFKTVLLKDNLLFDMVNEFKTNKAVDEKLKNGLSSGTYYFGPKDEWNMLDHFFVNQKFLDKKDDGVLLNSFEVFSMEAMKKELHKKINSDKEKGLKIVLAPKRYNFETDEKDKLGYSDHFPIAFKFEIKKPVEIKKVEKTKSKKKKPQ